MKDLQGIVWLVASLWVVRIADMILPWDLNTLGLVPRTLDGLIGIPLMPWLHGGWGHLLSNTVPLCILLLLLMSSRTDYLPILVCLIVFGGGLLWCFGREAVHIGASGLVYGLVAFLIASGFMERKLISMAIALLVGFLYGTTLFFGVLPTAGPNVSWDGHLFGALGGVLAALAFTRKNAPAEVSLSEAKDRDFA